MSGMTLLFSCIVGSLMVAADVWRLKRDASKKSVFKMLRINVVSILFYILSILLIALLGLGVNIYLPTVWLYKFIGPVIENLFHAISGK